MIPLIPNRLSYPEILCRDTFPELFYEDDNHFYDRLYKMIIDYKNLRNSIINYKKLILRFDWKTMKNEYDEVFEKLYN